MLTYEDCVGLSGLTGEEIAAIAKHEHLPEIVALEKASCLCESSDGKQLIRRMILDDIEQACGQGDTQTGGRLGLLLHHFIERELDRNETPGFCSGAGAMSPAWPRDRLESYLTAILHHFGIDRASAEARFGPEMEAAMMCCAACAETGSCRRFLAGVPGAEPPTAFCPAAPLLDELGRKLRSGKDE